MRRRFRPESIRFSKSLLQKNASGGKPLAFDNRFRNRGINKWDRLEADPTCKPGQLLITRCLKSAGFFTGLQFDLLGRCVAQQLAVFVYALLFVIENVLQEDHQWSISFGQVDRL